MNHKKVIRPFPLFIAILALAALSCSRIGRLPYLFATETPTSTKTSIPSPTFTPSPTLTPSQTPPPTPLPTGVHVEEQSDGTLLVLDYDNSYQLLLPPGWEVIVSLQEDLGKLGPNSAEMGNTFKDVDPDIFRLAAMMVDRKYIRVSAPTLLTINAFEDSMAGTMPMAFVTAMIEESILEDATSTTWDVIDNSNQVEVGVVRGTRTIRVQNGASVNLNELVIAFQAKGKLIVIEIAAPPGHADEILAPFDDMIDTISLDID